MSSQSSELEIIINNANINKNKFMSISSPLDSPQITTRTTLNQDELTFLEKDNLRESFDQKGENLIQDDSFGNLIDMGSTSAGGTVQIQEEQKEESKNNFIDPSKMTYEEQLLEVFGGGNQPPVQQA